MYINAWLFQAVICQKIKNRSTTICHKCHVVCLVCKLCLFLVLSGNCLEVFKWILWAHAKNSQHLHRKASLCPQVNSLTIFFCLFSGAVNPASELSKKLEHPGAEGIKIEKGDIPKTATKKDIICIDDDWVWQMMMMAEFTLSLSLSALFLLLLTFTCPKTPPPQIPWSTSSPPSTQQETFSSPVGDLLWPPRQLMCSWYHPSFHRLSFKNPKKKNLKTIYQFCGNQWLGGGNKQTQNTTKII